MKAKCTFIGQNDSFGYKYGAEYELNIDWNNHPLTFIRIKPLFRFISEHVFSSCNGSQPREYGSEQSFLNDWSLESIKNIERIISPLDPYGEEIWD